MLAKSIWYHTTTIYFYTTTGSPTKATTHSKPTSTEKAHPETETSFIPSDPEVPKKNGQEVRVLCLKKYFSQFYYLVVLEKDHKSKIKFVHH